MAVFYSLSLTFLTKKLKYESEPSLLNWNTFNPHRFDPDRDAKSALREYYETNRAYWWN